MQRLLGFAREHARAALSKPETQRESYLAFCKLNFKRYAIGISRSEAEAERFASALDRATRDLMIDMQRAATAAPAPTVSPWHPLRDDAVEGALDSVTVYEAAVEPQLPPPEDAEEPTVRDVRSDLAIAEELYHEDQQRLHAPPPPPVGHEEAAAAEEEDRQAAKFGFGGLERPQPLQPSAPVVEADPELRRKVQALLRARQAVAKPDADS